MYVWYSKLNNIQHIALRDISYVFYRFAQKRERGYNSIIIRCTNQKPPQPHTRQQQYIYIYIYCHEVSQLG